MGRQSKRFKVNNAGFSLIELIIVIAILGVLAGGASLGLSLAFSRDAERCASKLNDVLAEARTYTMSKDGDFCLSIKKDGDLFMAVILKYDNASSNYKEYKKISLEGDNKTIESISAGEDGSTLEPLSSSKECIVFFDRTKGNVTSCKVGGIEIKGIVKFKIEAARAAESRKYSEVSLITDTGKHKVGGFD